jgi:hypothetical protein
VFLLYIMAKRPALGNRKGDQESKTTQ